MSDIRHLLDFFSHCHVHTKHNVDDVITVYVNDDGGTCKKYTMPFNASMFFIEYDASYHKQENARASAANNANAAFSSSATANNNNNTHQDDLTFRIHELHTIRVCQEDAETRNIPLHPDQQVPEYNNNDEPMRCYGIHVSDYSYDGTLKNMYWPTSSNRVALQVIPNDNVIAVNIRVQEQNKFFVLQNCITRHPLSWSVPARDFTKLQCLPFSYRFQCIEFYWQNLADILQRIFRHVNKNLDVSVIKNKYSKYRRDYRPLMYDEFVNQNLDFYYAMLLGKISKETASKCFQHYKFCVGELIYGHLDAKTRFRACLELHTFVYNNNDTLVEQIEPAIERKHQTRLLYFNRIAGLWHDELVQDELLSIKALSKLKQLILYIIVPYIHLDAFSFEQLQKGTLTNNDVWIPDVQANSLRNDIDVDTATF